MAEKNYFYTFPFEEKTIPTNNMRHSSKSSTGHLMVQENTQPVFF